jgi:hypothetical protein
MVWSTLIVGQWAGISIFFLKGAAIATLTSLAANEYFSHGQIPFHIVKFTSGLPSRNIPFRKISFLIMK